jgi:hypothetical protein
MFRRSLRIRNAIVMSVAVLFSGAAAGCFGRFPATTAVYGFNKSISPNRVLQSLLMVAFIIIPVYPVASLVDVLVLNVIDFFSGTPLASKTQTLADGSTVEMIRVDKDTVRVRHTSADGHVEAFEVSRIGDKAGQLRRIDGRLMATVEELPDGRLITTTP